MLNLRVPRNFQRYLPIVLRQVKYASSSDSKDSHQHTEDHDKITTEKFRMLRPYIKDRDVKLEEKIISILETQQGPWTDQVTNVTGSRLEEEKLNVEKCIVKDTTSSTVNNNKDSKSIINCSQNLENLDYKSEIVSILNTPSPENVENNNNQADLTMVGLPLTLHHKDDSLLVTAMAQDLDEIYKKTTNMADRYYLSAHHRGLFWYTTLKIKLQNSQQIKNLLYNKAGANMFNKSGVWLTDSKPPSDPGTPAKDEKTVDQSESPVDKIKKIIENAINTIKQKIEEKKKSLEDKK